jgi:hypothetical protein
LRTDLEARHSDLPGFFLWSWDESKDCCENTDRGSDCCFRVCNCRLRNDVGRVALRYFVDVEWDAGGMKRPGARCVRPLDVCRRVAFVGLLLGLIRLDDFIGAVLRPHDLGNAVIAAFKRSGSDVDVGLQPVKLTGAAH